LAQPRHHAGDETVLRRGVFAGDWRLTKYFTSIHLWFFLLKIAKKYWAQF
jgi:hypothetical protein